MDKNVDCKSGQTTLHSPEMEKNVDIQDKQKMVQNSSTDKNILHRKDITQMSGKDIKSHFISSGEEFSSKMTENFKCCVFIAASKGTEDCLDTVVQMMTYFNGYLMHRTVGCSQRIYHLYVKYETEYIAIAARDLFRSKQYHAEIVDDMLRLWYAFEKASARSICQTIAWLTNANGKYITSDSANLVLSKYGNPDIKAVVDKTVKVSFNSLAEAFGACIAQGPWYYNNALKDPNYYSLRIELTFHTSKIMRMCNMTNVAREFDYFTQNDPNVYSKTSVSLPSNETKADQPIKVTKIEPEPEQQCKVTKIEPEPEQQCKVTKIEPEQPIKSLTRCYDKRSNRNQQKNRNGGRTFRRNYGNFPFSYDQNRWSQAYL